MNIAIVDDQKEYRELIVQRLSKISEFEINTYSFEDTSSLKCSKVLFNLIILDIDLIDENGLDFAKNNLTENIVFMTSYDFYMKKAFGKNVYAFIEKSDSEEIFLETIKSIIKQIFEEKTMSVKCDKGVVDIFIKDIIYLQYIRRKTICIKLEKNDYIITGYGIQELSKKLEDMFIFCDRDILINKHRIIGIDNNNLYLRDLDYTLKISARRLKEVKNVYFLEKKHEIII
ncbi:LytR/AlgR family response regulator transcription factor [Longibaculum muris]|uniref:LytR/AlgR family response regulator transcription factor n=2 Tax=Longibaculum muris TaxID=1796628 RepID=UPI00189DB758|nr:LytTR family transcriptional regulator DNA-binding domain-containing protein [Longibaculum muris]